MSAVEPFTIRLARPEDEAAIAGLVVEGFLDKFRPIFGKQMDHSIRVMERWIQLEHAAGGVSSLVSESAGEITASVGVRTGSGSDDALSRGLWRVLIRNLGLLRTLWATTLLSYPRYTSTPREAYVERLVVAPEFRNKGMARGLLSSAENLARGQDKQFIGLHVSGTNLPALKLYESAGYLEVSRQNSLLTGRFLKIRTWIYLRKEL
jgi:GNAT superfamily N-acetyltransferase